MSAENLEAPGGDRVPDLFDSELCRDNEGGAHTDVLLLRQELVEMTEMYRNIV